jgi:hypothetical protein
MAETAALLVYEVLQGYPIHQWVFSLPIPLRLQLAIYPSRLSNVMQIISRAISTHIVNKAGFSNKLAQMSAVTVIQRFGSELNLNIHISFEPLDFIGKLAALFHHQDSILPNFLARNLAIEQNILRNRLFHGRSAVMPINNLLHQ